ncbi:hypothetical protein BDR03DRAFT_963569 [Suillus americanus]|nr:hypothetical protein BDR03DRAFT_963569 [Suillus americanus]
MLYHIPTISLPDTECFIIFVVLNWTSIVVFAMLWAIIITRLHAMYQLSRKVLIFLIVTFLAVNIFNGLVAVMITVHTSGEELILSGIYQCSIDSTGYAEYILLLGLISGILALVWVVLALCHTVWMTIKHFRELRQYSAGGIVGDCFTMLMKTHILYFTGMVAISCFTFILNFAPTFSTDPLSLERQIYSGLLQILAVLQSFVLGPRLILSIREYHAKLVADSDAATGMTSIAFKELVHTSTGSSV